VLQKRYEREGKIRGIPNEIRDTYVQGKNDRKRRKKSWVSVKTHLCRGDNLGGTPTKLGD